MGVLGVRLPCVVRESGHGRADSVTPLDRNEGEILMERNHTMRRILAVATGVLVGVLSIDQGSAQADSQSVRPGKRSPVSIRLATSTPAQGHEELTFGGRTLYLVPRATLAGSKVVSAEAITTRSGSDIELALTDEGADWLSSAISKHKADHVAIFAGRKPLGSAMLTFEAGEGSLKLVGLTGEQAERLVRVLNRSAVAPAGATFTVVPDRTTIQPGETVNVRVFLSGASQGLAGPHLPGEAGGPGRDHRRAAHRQPVDRL